NVARIGRWGGPALADGRDMGDELGVPEGRSSEQLEQDYSKALALKVVELAQQSGRSMTIYKASLKHSDVDAEELQEMLSQTREVLREVLRESDVVVNTSDADFLILLPAGDDIPTMKEMQDYVYRRAGLTIDIVTISGAEPLGRAARL
ncbi:MAG: hypothetical protein ACPHN3_06590, partial [Spongiibacter sp.]